MTSVQKLKEIKLNDEENNQTTQLNEWMKNKETADCNVPQNSSMGS